MRAFYNLIELPNSSLAAKGRVICSLAPSPLGRIYAAGSFNFDAVSFSWPCAELGLDRILQEAWPGRPRCKFNEIGCPSLRDT